MGEKKSGGRKIPRPPSSHNKPVVTNKSNPLSSTTHTTLAPKVASSSKRTSRGGKSLEDIITTSIFQSPTEPSLNTMNHAFEDANSTKITSSSTPTRVRPNKSLEDIITDSVAQSLTKVEPKAIKSKSGSSSVVVNKSLEDIITEGITDSVAQSNQSRAKKSDATISSIDDLVTYYSTEQSHTISPNNSLQSKSGSSSIVVAVRVSPLDPNEFE